jgi:hypothetical protein
MGIQVRWDNPEKTVIRHSYDANWTLKDYYELIETHRKLLGDVSHRVDIISDLRRVHYLPDFMLTGLRYVLGKKPRNEGLKVVVGAVELVKVLFEVLYSEKPEESTTVYARNVEEAYNLIAQDQLQNIAIV